MEYRIEGGHYIEYVDTRINGKQDRRIVRIWCADDNAFDVITDKMYSQGAYYIHASHNTFTDGHGNARMRAGYWESPAHFYYTNKDGQVVRADHFAKGNAPAETSIGANKTWLLESYYMRCENGTKTKINCFLKNEGRNGKVFEDYIRNASTCTEYTAKEYAKNHPEKHARAISMIDWLNENHN